MAKALEWHRTFAEQCGKKGIHSAIVISAGFREVGPKGVEREQRLKDICRDYGISMIGPKDIGVDVGATAGATFAEVP